MIGSEIAQVDAEVNSYRMVCERCARLEAAYRDCAVIGTIPEGSLILGY